MTSSRRTVGIVSVALGGTMLLGVGGAAAIAATQAALRPASTSHETLTASTSAISLLTVDSPSAQVTVQFGDVTDAVLEVRGDRANDWRMVTNGNELHVGKDAGWFRDGCFLLCFGLDRTEVTLTLPRALGAGQLDAEFDVASGAFDASGSFRNVDFDLSSGTFTFAGAAASLVGDISSGNAEVRTEHTGSLRFDLASGALDAVVTGAAPRTTELDVSSGKVALTLPDAEYRYSQDVSSGKVTNELRTSPVASSSVDLDLSSGKVMLTALR